MNNILKSLFIFLAVSTFSSYITAQPALPPMPPKQDLDIESMIQTKLSHLKEKLNLESSQQVKWNAWSSKVLIEVKVRHAQMQDREKMWLQQENKEMTTPEKQDQQIQKVSEHIAMMQDHLGKLRDSKSSTLDFYSSLDKNQKTIFDLYWGSVNSRHRWVGGLGHHSHMMGQN
jgi:hypothetical protein